MEERLHGKMRGGGGLNQGYGSNSRLTPNDVKVILGRHVPRYHCTSQTPRQIHTDMPTALQFHCEGTGRNESGWEVTAFWSTPDTDCRTMRRPHDPPSLRASGMSPVQSAFPFPTRRQQFL